MTPDSWSLSWTALCTLFHFYDEIPFEVQRINYTSTVTSIVCVRKQSGYQPRT